jgi:hypothetical protein
VDSDKKIKIAVKAGESVRLVLYDKEGKKKADLPGTCAAGTGST